jgi:hypothetical protein
MEVWTRFRETLRSYGLEYFGKYYSFYRGSVCDNDDPEVLGRLRVKCPQIYGKISPDIWAYPRGMFSGSYVIPKINDPVYVTFENGDPRFPCWEYGWHYAEKAPTGSGKDSFIFQTPAGQRIELNDSDEKITLKNKGGFVIDLTKDGIKIHKGGDSLKKSLDNLYAEIKLITVPTPLGPSGTPINQAKFDLLLQSIEKFLI